MKTDITKQQLSNGWEVALRYNMRDKLFRDILYMALVAQKEGLGDIQRDYRNLFCWCAAHTQYVSGTEAWKPPKEGEDYEASFQVWLNAAQDETVVAEWYDHIRKLNLPVAAAEQQPLKLVPEDQQTDPNSSRAVRSSRQRSKKTSGE